MKKYPVLFLLLFLLLLFSFGCGSPSQDIGGGQSSQSQEALPTHEAPVALAENPASSQQELTSQQGESSFPEDGTPENVFAVYGDDKLIAAWGTDAEGNSYPISKERAEKLIPKLKSKAFNSPYLVRNWGGAHIVLDPFNGIGYETDEQFNYFVCFNNLPNPCSEPFVFKLGWVSPNVSENTITTCAPEIPGCALGGMVEYTSGGIPGQQWCNINNTWGSVQGYVSAGGGGLYSRSSWLTELRLECWVHLYIFGPHTSSLGMWQIPAYAGGTSICPTLMMRKLIVENLSSEPAPSGGYIIKGDVVVLPDRPQPPAVLNWTMTIEDANQDIVYTQKGTGDKIEVAWDGTVVVASKGNIPEPTKDSALYFYYVDVEAPQEFTRTRRWGQLRGNPSIEVWTTDYPSPSAKRIATSDPEADQQTLLNQVFLPARQGNNVKIVVKDPPTSGSTYQVGINTTKTKQPLTLTLAKGSKNEYTGSLDLGSPLIVNNPRDHQTTFTSLDTTDRADSNAFINQMKFTSTIPAYPLQRLQMGCAWAGANPLDPLKFEEIEPSLSAVQAAGFEEVIVSFPDDKPDIKARFRVKNEADVLYISGHGDYETNTLLGYDKAPCPGSTLQKFDWGDNLNTVIIAGCSVLDINDYNGNAHQKFPDLSSYAPGLKWDGLDPLDPGKRIFLGYNFTAPAPSYRVPSHHWDADIINKYFEYLPLFTKNSQPVAWLRANGDLDIFDNACAIDKEAYYFIKYNIDPFNKNLHISRIFYKIPRPWPATWEKAFEKAILLGRLQDQE